MFRRPLRDLRALGSTTMLRMRDTCTIATRGSKLALWQAEYIRGLLRSLCPRCRVNLQVIKTKGDIIQDVALSKVGGKGLFVKEIEEALLNGSADLAVHSIKDVPMQLPTGLLLGCIPKRDTPADCLLSCAYPDLDSLPLGAHVGTSSLRRQAQLKALRPDLHISSLRGNVDTRLRKLQEGAYDAIVLAAVGLKRLALHAPFASQLDTQVFLPAVGQGAIGIECREDDYELFTILSQLEDTPTRVCIEAERAFSRALDGGCQVPIAGYAVLCDDETLQLHGLVAELDGSCIIRDSVKGHASLAHQLGVDLAKSLLSRGGRTILDRLNQQ